MKVKPLHDRVIVQLIEPETRTSSGIVIPDSAQEKPMSGRVLSVGPGRVSPDGHLMSMAVKAGDTVLFGKYTGQAVRINNEELTILREEEILAIVE